MSASAIGATSAPRVVSWTSFDCLLYALGVGAGADDWAGAELAFTTENSAGLQQRVLPTFPLVVGGPGGEILDEVGEFDRTMIVHGEQALELHAPLRAEGSAMLAATITGVYDKGSGALVTTETVATDILTSSPLWTNRASSFIRGAGGFGGGRGPSGVPSIPKRQADHTVECATRTDQALLYRLSGDRHPLHSDPAFARAGGFARPILQGLGTFGFTARALLHTLCGSDPDRFMSVSGRFSSPVYPGDTLTISIWEEEEGKAAFSTATPNGVVVDGGRLTYRGPY